jgi:hypothetical protein
MLAVLMDRHDEGREDFLERKKQFLERELEWKEREQEWKEREKELKEKGNELRERDRKQQGNTLCIRYSLFSIVYIFNTCTHS